jgi:hypothetical protein
MSDDSLLSADTLRLAFRLLGGRLQAKGVTADIFVFGGAAMVLGFDARPGTRDVDALWRPHAAVIDAARDVARELGLPQWWLNEQASAYLPSGTGFEGSVMFDAPGIRVVQASPELLLAMKVAASRQGDLDDIRLLAAHLGLTSAADVLALAERVLGEPIASRKRMIVEDLFAS